MLEELLPDINVQDVASIQRAAEHLAFRSAATGAWKMKGRPTRFLLWRRLPRSRVRR